MKYILGSLTVLLLTFMACKEDNPVDDPELPPYNPTFVNLEVPSFFQQPNFPENNPLTEQGILLGRMLFYDPVLSGDSTLSCSGCHFQANAFSDTTPSSEGIDGIFGARNSMPIFNLAYINNFFWDGRAQGLEEQILRPVPDPIEMHLPWDEAEVKLLSHDEYPDLFYEAFGNYDITRFQASKAIAQFLRTIISGSSKFDEVVFGTSGVNFNDQEEAGYTIFRTETGIPGDSECTHCHGLPLFTDNLFHNNGLDEAATLNDFEDLGVGAITDVEVQNGMFKTPSLRNIAVTGPYMHDGRFATLREVLDHYSEGIHFSPNVDALLASEYTNATTLNYTDEQKDNLIAFLNTLTDSLLINNEAFSSPFE